MNQSRTRFIHRARPLALAIAGTLLVSACASTPKLSDGAVSARARLTQLQSDPQLAPRAQVAIREAELAVVAAETSRKKDEETRTHLAYMAGHKVDLAQSLAQQRLLEDQRKALSEQREAARLDARTREADNARHDANVARNDAAMAQDAAASARDAAASARDDARAARDRTEAANLEADAANRKTQEANLEADAANRKTTEANMATDAAQAAAASATQAAAELQRQIVELNARETDRGLVVTLGDVLFATGKSDLRGASAGHLDKLAAFLARYSDRTVTVEGHTDSVGSDATNLGLSQRRADAVKGYLVSRGISNARLTASGMGEGTPVSDNGTATGRQQNRRVEVVIANPMVGTR